MFSHVHVGVTDFQRAFAFYSAVMDALELTLKFCEPEKPWAGWKSKDAERPLFLIGHPFDGQSASPGNGQMTAFQVPNREMVRKSYAAAIAQGGTSEGEPGLRPQYHANYYGAYFRDPDGNKICICCHAAVE